MLTLAIILFLFFEIANILFTVRFGIKRPLDQSLNYRKVRLWLRMASYILATITSVIYLLNGLFFVGTFIFFLPYIIEKFLYWFCRRRAIRRTNDNLVNQGKHGNQTLAHEDAESAALSIVDGELKLKEILF